MSRAGAVVIIAILGFGCGSREARVCAHAKELCGKDVIADSCASDLKDLAESMGDSYGKTLDCAADARSCSEAVGCMAGGMGNALERWGNQLGKGFDKGRGSRDDADRRDRDRQRDDGNHSLLASCADFKSQRESDSAEKQLTARWSGCRDHVERTILCKTFIDDLKCDCLEDGVSRWTFTAVEPALDARASAERIATASCKMGFGN